MGGSVVLGDIFGANAESDATREGGEKASATERNGVRVWRRLWKTRGVEKYKRLFQMAWKSRRLRGIPNFHQQ